MLWVFSRRNFSWGFPGGSEVKASACNARDLGSIPGSGRFPWRRKWQPILAWRIPWMEEPGGPLFSVDLFDLFLCKPKQEFEN